MGVSDNNSQIIPMKMGNSVAYVLDSGSLFSPTEYKVLRSNTENYFVRCTKVMYNGKVQLFYSSEHFVVLSELMSSLNEESFLTVIGSLFRAISAVNSNGFISCQGIALDENQIFVDPSALSVRLLYLPTVLRFFSGTAQFESHLRSLLRALIAHNPQVSGNRINELMNALSAGVLSTDDLAASLRWTEAKDSIPKTGEQAVKTQRLSLIATNAPVWFELEITKDEFTIGKKQDQVDGTIPFNRLISRCHCKVVRTRDGYAIIDLNSSNGTYVNGTKLYPQQACPLRAGDVVHLANSEFMVKTK